MMLSIKSLADRFFRPESRRVERGADGRPIWKLYYTFSQPHRLNLWTMKADQHDAWDEAWKIMDDIPRGRILRTDGEAVFRFQWDRSS